MKTTRLPDPEPEDTNPPELSPESESGGSVYCQLCEMWLNGPTQLEDHKIGKKHKKNVRSRLKNTQLQ